MSAHPEADSRASPTTTLRAPKLALGMARVRHIFLEGSGQFAAFIRLLLPFAAVADLSFAECAVKMERGVRHGTVHDPRWRESV